MAGSPKPGLVSKAESVMGCGEPMICKRFLPGMAAYSSAFVPCVYVCLSFAYTSLSPKTCDSAHFCESAAARYLLCRHLFDVGVCCSFLPLMRVGPPFPLLLSVSWAGSVSSAGFCSLEHNPNKRRNSPLSSKNCCKLQGCWINFQKAKIRPLGRHLWLLFPCFYPCPGTALLFQNLFATLVLSALVSGLHQVTWAWQPCLTFQAGLGGLGAPFPHL